MVCSANVGYPPITNISIVKNDRVLASTTGAAVKISTSTTTSTPFGKYICLINSSGITFEETVVIKEEGEWWTWTTCGSIIVTVMLLY